ncbi:NAD(P)-binding protein [Hypomontagnella monticulosa]|nr:NAD(P)-binding protein [Hypomontagnella monticulosa]
MAPKVVLISGANRGLGKGLLERYLARPNHIVIAANRNPEHPTSKALDELPKGQGSRLVVIKIDASIESDAAEGIGKLISQGIEHLDIVISSAGELLGHLTPDLFGMIWLYQATLPLLKLSANPKWITIGSVGAKIEDLREQPPIPNAAYATSKIAAHWLTKRMNHEEEWLTAFVLHPGWVDTDMGRAVADAFGGSDKIDIPFITLEESCGGMVKLINEATKESRGGRFWGYDGVQESW